MSNRAAIAVPLLVAGAAAAGLYAACERGSLSCVHLLKAPEPGDIRVACVGDSITYGYGIRRWSQNNYPAQLSALLGKGWCVNNYGCSGRTASTLGDYPYEQERIFRKSLAFLPDIVVLMLGTNDSKPGNWRGTAAYGDDLRRLVCTYRNLATHPRIILLTPPPAWPAAGGEVLYDIRAEVIEHGIRPAVMDLAKAEGLGFVDVFAACEGRSELFWDGVHPGTGGAELIARKVFDALEEGGIAHG